MAQKVLKWSSLFFEIFLVPTWLRVPIWSVTYVSGLLPRKHVFSATSFPCAFASFSHIHFSRLKVCSMAFGGVLLQYRSTERATETAFRHLRHPAETINWFLCSLFLKSETYQVNLKDVIKLNIKLG